MSPKDRRTIRKMISFLKDFRDNYAKENDTGTSSKFARAMAILTDILDEDIKEAAYNES